MDKFEGQTLEKFLFRMQIGSKDDEAENPNNSPAFSANKKKHAVGLLPHLKFYSRISEDLKI